MGLVTAINGASRGAVRVKGESGHDGAMPMAMRRDALAATAEMLLAIERRAAAEPHLVATVECLKVSNADVNTIPREVSFMIDVRAPSDSSLRDALADIVAEIARIAEARGVEAYAAFGYDAPAAVCDAGLVEGLAAAVARRGYTTLRLSSGSGHDATSFRGRIPFAMLFVRCRGGVSHNPAEYASAEDLRRVSRARTVREQDRPCALDWRARPDSVEDPSVRRRLQEQRLRLKFPLDQLCPGGVSGTELRLA